MPDTVEQFRKLTGSPGHSPPRGSRPPVPPRETALVLLLLANIAWLTFALGGVRLWGELAALVLSLATLALLPSWKSGEIPGTPGPVWILMRFPLFWLGFGLYAFFFIESWNLAWNWTHFPGGRPVLIARNPPLSWLPAGLESPMDESNPFRSMTFYTLPWIAACSAWAGLNTRRSNLRLLNGMALCGVAFALIALGQHFLGMEKVLGIFPTVPHKQGFEFPFWGTLINENHAAMYLVLVNGLCLGLFLSGWHHEIQRFHKGGGSWLLYLGLTVIASFTILMAQARGGILLLALQWLLFVILCSIVLIRWFGLKGLAFPLLMGLVILGSFVVFITNPAVFERMKREWVLTLRTVDTPELEGRTYMMRISWDMIRDRPWYGHGAGGFRYLHLPYKAEYPEFVTESTRYVVNPETGEREVKTFTVWYQNAHVDLLEYLVEWGIIGCLFPALAIGWLALTGWRCRKGWDAGTLTILMTVVLLFLGAGVEFHFRIPLILLSWCLAATTVVKLARLATR